ncbi:NAD(P)H-dependent oxidoreductase [Psychrosphaera aquimarina]|uniref:FMN dependent NADH:quinone oxidoreductase n=1 Tax=Psychrosphaera aquimarina TaxID=2044854 RepID=A0ABU3QYN0_9GAMM|nr:NAD(P)H-dependent oxidoreductase [Psychrosphaera aquimarina]MDU0112551.1 NAD(P)H-dependent oxidoreductase [Psychrosphaera aquimarina]
MNTSTNVKNVLLINSSLNGEQGNSNRLASEFVAKLSEKFEVKVTERDLAKDPLPHLSQAEMGAWMTAANDRTEEQVQLADISDSLIEELKNNDTLVIGMPMYNFGIPSTFKVWIDRIARAGITFSYTENGPVGLLESKKAIIVAARGGMYAGTPKDSQSQYLKDVLAFVGITDVQFIYAEALNMPAKDENVILARQAMDVTAEALI